MYYICDVYLNGIVNEYSCFYTKNEKKLGTTNQADLRKVHPVPSGLVSPSEVGIRKLIKTEVQKRDDKDGDKKEEKVNALQLPELEKRDPKSINAHITVNFEDVLGEPDGVRSPDCCWMKYWYCYTCCKNLLYTCTSFICGFPLATMYGCMFAFMTFPNVWNFTPCSSAIEICCAPISRFLKYCTLCVFGTPCESCGKLFWAFNTREKKRSLMLSRRTVKVTFSDKIRTKRIPARKPEDRGRVLTRFEIIRQMSVR